MRYTTVKARTSADNQNFRRGIKHFLDEGRRVARLSHPNIMEVKQFFLLNGTGYIVFRYEKGPTLKERLGKGTLPESSLRAMLRGLLEGLIVVHEQGLVHRDIKPSNIILSRSRSTTHEVPVLIDFGAAREFSHREGREMTALVTPGYSPTEQYMRGKQGPPTDLYALGATAYRCIAGEPPPESKNRVKNDTMVPAVERGRGLYSVELLALIDRLLNISETARPASAVEALAAVKLLPALKAEGSSSNGKGASSGAKLQVSMTARGSGTRVSTPGIEVHADGAKQVVLELPNPEKIDLLMLALRISPPGKYLAERTGFQDTPYYFPFDNVAGDDEVVGFRCRGDLQSRIDHGSEVEISSETGVLARAVWPLGKPRSDPHPDGRMFRPAWIAALIVVLTGFAAFAMNIGRFQDAFCEKAGLCTVAQAAFRDAEACIRQSPKCNIEACGTPVRNVTAPRLAARYAELEAEAGSVCRAEDTAALAEAEACAMRATSCEAGSCFASYLTKYPNGAAVAQAGQAQARARQACAAASAPPPVQLPKKGGAPPVAKGRQQSAQELTPAAQPSSPAIPPRPQVALPDGVYDAERTFTGPKSRTDPANCPPLQRLRVTVSGDKLTFEVTEGAAQIRRTWHGTILEPITGKISFMGHKAQPEMITKYTILGDYNAAVVDSLLCETGVFKIIK